MGSDNLLVAAPDFVKRFQSTLPGWGATRLVSICRPRRHFNPRSPDGERQNREPMKTRLERFQSTLPGWGATPDRTVPGFPAGYFNPRSPDGERHDFRHRHPQIVDISIHAPRMGSDLRLAPYGHAPLISIHAPRMGSDAYPKVRTIIFDISIHAPRMGSDIRFPSCVWGGHDFNPRSPDGERRPSFNFLGGFRAYFNPRSPDGERPLADKENETAQAVFQSTLPGWGATCPLDAILISMRFQSTLPGWGATNPISLREIHARISIHAPRMGSDDSHVGGHVVLDISIHAPRMGSDNPVSAGQVHTAISIHAPRMGSDCPLTVLP